MSPVVSQKDQISRIKLAPVKLNVLDYDGTMVKDGTNPVISFLSKYLEVKNKTIKLLRANPETLNGVMSGRTLEEVRNISNFFLADVDKTYYAFMAAENGSVIELPCRDQMMVETLAKYAYENELKYSYDQKRNSVTLLTAKYDRRQLFKECIADVLSVNQLNLDGVTWAHSEIPETELQGRQAKILAELSNGAELDFVKTIANRQSGIVIKFAEAALDNSDVKKFLAKAKDKCDELGVRFHTTLDENNDGTKTLNVDIAQSDKGKAIRHLNYIFQAMLEPGQVILPTHIGNAGNDLPAFKAALELNGQAFLIDSPQLDLFDDQQREQVAQLEKAGMTHVKAEAGNSVFTTALALALFTGL